jgi:succinoglycan biosynthesis protein ExoA
MNLPYVTVLLPIRNEEKSIESCLQAVLRQDYPADRMEIIIADGLSQDRTREIVARFQEKHSNLLLIDNPGLIVPTGLNAALTKAQGEIIVRVDGHTIIEPDYVRECVNALQRQPADNVGGKMNAIGRTAFGNAVAVATSSPFGVGSARFHYSNNEEFVDTVYMGAWRRDVFERIGLFDEELIRDQDDEFNYRLREHGGRILLTPKIKSQYTGRSNPRALWKQYFQYGLWKVRVLQKHPRQMSWRQFVPPVFVLSLLVSTIMSAFTRAGAILLALAFGSYLIANLAASIYTASKRGWNHLLRLPLIYGILHISYGSGFLTGLAKFWNRWRDKQGKAIDYRIPNP